jgi:hypothetical protein
MRVFFREGVRHAGSGRCVPCVLTLVLGCGRFYSVDVVVQLSSLLAAVCCGWWHGCVLHAVVWSCTLIQPTGTSACLDQDLDQISLLSWVLFGCGVFGAPVLCSSASACCVCLACAAAALSFHQVCWLCV